MDFLWFIYKLFDIFVSQMDIDLPLEQFKVKNISLSKAYYSIQDNSEWN